MTVPPVTAPASVALKVTEVKPVPATVNVAMPVSVLSAVTVTFWAAAKLAGVNVSEARRSPTVRCSLMPWWWSP